MRSTKLSIALLAVVVLSVVTAGTATAATTTAAEWYTGTGTGTTLEGSTGLKMAIQPGSVFVLEWKRRIGVEREIPIKLTATGIECKSCTIENKPLTEKAGKVAFGTGRLNFTGVTVDEPIHCAVSDETGVTGQILTRPLNFHADLMDGTKAALEFFPAAGAGTSFAIFHLTNTKEMVCPLAEQYVAKGSLTADAVNATGVQAASQQINALNSGLEVSPGSSVKLTGSAILSLTSGSAFGVH